MIPMDDDSKNPLTDKEHLDHTAAEAVLYLALRQQIAPYKAFEHALTLAADAGPRVRFMVLNAVLGVEVALARRQRRLDPVVRTWRPLVEPALLEVYVEELAKVRAQSLPPLATDPYARPRGPGKWVTARKIASLYDGDTEASVREAARAAAREVDGVRRAVLWGGVIAERPVGLNRWKFWLPQS